MTEFLRRNQLIFASIALVGVSLQFMSMSTHNPQFAKLGTQTVETAVYPVQKLTHEVFESSKYAWRHYLWLLDVESERTQLANRVKELEAQNSRLMEYESENGRLKHLLNYLDNTARKGLAAAIIGRDPSNWIKTVTIDRGNADGVRAGLPVVDGNAVVGQIIAVTEHSARVLLITDSTSSVDAIVQSTRVSGIIDGGLKDGFLKLRYVEKLPESKVQLGDRVITSGLDGVYPKGTLIGVVERVEANSSGLFQDIDVRPSINIKRIESVLVLMDEERR